MPAIINDTVRQKLLSDLKGATNATFKLKFYNYGSAISKRTNLGAFSGSTVIKEVVLAPANIYYAIDKSLASVDEQDISIGGKAYYYASSITTTKDALWNCLFFVTSITENIANYNTIVVTYSATGVDELILMIEKLPTVQTIEASALEPENINGLIKF